MFSKNLKDLVKAPLLLLALTPMASFADTIDPATYTDTLAVGESVTIRKTVTIEETTSSSVLDVMFVFDTTGSMGPYIAGAKSKASEILTSLAGFGDLASGTGWYGDPSYDGVYTDLTSTDATTAAAINSFGACFMGDCGGDFPEKGYAAIKEAADSASWRPGSNRFIITFGDASFKTPPTEAATLASLAAADATVIGISFSSSFTSSITPLTSATGGSVYASSASGDSIAAAILAAVEESFSKYTEVTVDDLGLGMPGVDVSVACVSADTGVCVGADAVGDYDRSVARTFEYDVTFTGVAAGDYAFPTYALVDGGIVATERDTIHVTGGADVPEPATLALVGLGLLGMGAARRRR